MSITETKTVFTISPEMIRTGAPIPYRIFINSSARQGFDRFVCMVKDGSSLTPNEVQELKRRFHNLYLRESDRGKLLKEFTSDTRASDLSKASLIKDSAIKYLGRLFDEETQLTSKVLTESLEGCKDTVTSIIQVVKSGDMEKIQSLIGQLSYHDFYTYDHSINVSMYCVAIYRLLKPDASDRELQLAGLGGLLHDIGKIKIPTSIINSTEKLTDEQFKMIKKHPGWGYDLLRDPSLEQNLVIDNKVISQIIYQHHENFDGSGYPNNIGGDSIHILAI